MGRRILSKLNRKELVQVMMELNDENEQLREQVAYAEAYGVDTPEELKESLTRITERDLNEETERIDFRTRYLRTVLSTFNVLIVVAAIAVLLASFILPTFQIYGSSMTPTLHEGDIVIALKNSDMKKGDLIAFYYNNKILVKRVIAAAGEWVDIDENGNVWVNSQPLDEPYVSEKALDDCDLEFPYQVPEGRVFVMGDHRSVSIDSRNSEIGCVSTEQIAGELAFRVWPLKSFKVY